MPSFYLGAVIPVPSPQFDDGPAARVAKLLPGRAVRRTFPCSPWHNAEENGGWAPTDLWGVDTAVGEDMLAVWKLALDSRRYFGDRGFEPEIEAIWRLWAARVHRRG